MTSDANWYTQHENAIGDLRAQIRAREQQIQAEREGDRRMAAERAEAERIEQAKLDARLDQELAPRKEQRRREYRRAHDGYDGGFEAYWGRIRADELAEHREQQIEQAVIEMRQRAWLPSPPGARRMVELRPEDG